MMLKQKVEVRLMDIVRDLTDSLYSRDDAMGPRAQCRCNLVSGSSSERVSEV